MYKIVSCKQQCFYEEKGSNTTLVNTIPNGSIAQNSVLNYIDISGNLPE
ncbi:MAG: hypothetical protein CM15mP23_22590 [Cryomorphaceae bacterium]|nr:MAG: hypothetical protein CM15mP23_22590 [Cryomorphaceae bacterium]